MTTLRITVFFLFILPPPMFAQGDFDPSGWKAIENSEQRDAIGRGFSTVIAAIASVSNHPHGEEASWLESIIEKARAMLAPEGEMSALARNVAIAIWLDSLKDAKHALIHPGSAVRLTTKRFIAYFNIWLSGNDTRIALSNVKTEARRFATSWKRFELQTFTEKESSTPQALTAEENQSIKEQIKAALAETFDLLYPTAYRFIFEKIPFSNAGPSLTETQENLLKARLQIAYFVLNPSTTLNLLGSIYGNLWLKHLSDLYAEDPVGKNLLAFAIVTGKLLDSAHPFFAAGFFAVLKERSKNESPNKVLALWLQDVAWNQIEKESDAQPAARWASTQLNSPIEAAGLSPADLDDFDMGVIFQATFADPLETPQIQHANLTAQFLAWQLERLDSIFFGEDHQMVAKFLKTDTAVELPRVPFLGHASTDFLQFHRVVAYPQIKAMR